MIIEDAQAIRMVRTEEGKALRKDYESGAIHHGFNEHREMELRTDGVANTLSTVQKDNYICEKSIVAMRGTHGYANNCIQQQYRIRKLTPLECWRLMDFTDEDFYKAAQVNSNTQLYKQAGNSIVVNVLVAILGQMIPGKEDYYKEME